MNHTQRPRIGIRWIAPLVSLLLCMPVLPVFAQQVGLNYKNAPGKGSFTLQVEGLTRRGTLFVPVLAEG